MFVFLGITAAGHAFIALAAMQKFKYLKPFFRSFIFFAMAVQIGTSTPSGYSR